MLNYINCDSLKVVEVQWHSLQPARLSITHPTNWKSESTNGQWLRCEFKF